MAKGKFSIGEKRAFWAGKGYRAGLENKVIPFKEGGKNIKSFRKGYKVAGPKVATFKERGQK